MRSRNQHKSQLQEKRVAEDLDGKVQKASGATDFAKGDVRVKGNLRVECKTTSAKSYSLKLAEIIKIQSEALTGGCEDWAMQIEFRTSAGITRRFAIVDWQTFLDMQETKESIGAVSNDSKS